MDLRGLPDRLLEIANLVAGAVGRGQTFTIRFGQPSLVPLGGSESEKDRDGDRLLLREAEASSFVVGPSGEVQDERRWIVPTVAGYVFPKNLSAAESEWAGWYNQQHDCMVMEELSWPVRTVPHYYHMIGEAKRQFLERSAFAVVTRELSQRIATAELGPPDTTIRAAAVMGWCAAVARIHRTVEKIGFQQFNVASAAMASQTQGRFKQFNKAQSVTSISKLQLVLDTDILWILEGMQVIDANQHARLRSCFELRNHSAHPGEAPVTDYNLLSFFSDIIEIVLQNPKFV